MQHKKQMRTYAMHICMTLDWTDLRYLLAVQRGHTLSAAARQLGVNQTTVGRRLEALEAALGARLFRRASDGYFLTRDGERALAHAERIEAEIHAVERAITGEDARPEGVVRLTTFESLGTCFVAPRLGRFRERYPAIDLQLNLDNRPLNLSRREADLAVRPKRPTQAALQIRKIGSVAAGLYASPAYLRRHGEPRSVEELAQHLIIADEETNAHYDIQRWLLRLLPRGAKVALRCDHALAQAAAAVDGVGIAALYCYVGDGERRLRRVLPEEELVNDLWLAVHRDLQYAARVRALIDYLVEIAARDADVLTGRRRARASGA